jgi:UDP-hydrolysing UDP-N-acetyl-D-glucosamine 2-epimerase
MQAAIGVFTANRAEYGLLAPLLAAIQQSEAVNLQLMVAQDHWLTGTVAEILADGFSVDIPIKPNPSAVSIAEPGPRMVALCADLMAQLATQPLKLDAIVLLGDRFEAAACAMAAKLLAIPIIHLAGGDITEGGCVDDNLRDMITCLASWHGPTTEKSAARLRQMGIAPDRIMVTGSLVYDNVHQLPLLDKAELFQLLGLSVSQPVALFTQHPIPAEGPVTVQHMHNSLLALKQLNTEMGLQTVATYPNMDGYAAELQTVIHQHDWAVWVPSLGRLRYLSMMKHCNVVVGNTSSGLIETPFFRVPSVTIGPRQLGRERANNVLTSSYGVTAVKHAVSAALTHLLKADNPFGNAPAAPNIMALIQQAISAKTVDTAPA